MTKIRGTRRGAFAGLVLSGFATVLVVSPGSKAHAQSAYQLALATPVGRESPSFTTEDVNKAPGFDVVQANDPAPSEQAPPAKLRTTHAKRAKATVSRAAKSRNVAPKRSAAALALKASAAAGRYEIEREGGKDTGCMLTFDDQAKAPGGDKATLASACKDQGILIFDPVGWRLADGRLVLTARRGYTTHLDLQPDGTWRKDPKDGKPLVLKKM